MDRKGELAGWVERVSLEGGLKGYEEKMGRSCVYSPC